jgi:hypothetical protein
MVGLLCASVLGLATNAAAQEWDLSHDFSTIANPTGVWSFGSKTALSAGLDLYTDTARIPAHYGTSQLAGWSDPRLDIIPYVLKNVSGSDWVYDGRAVGGGLAILPSQDVLLHPSSLSDRFSVVQWTAPTDGLFSLDAEFQRFEQVEGMNSNYFVLKDGLLLPGGSGLLVGFNNPASKAHYTDSSLFLNAGETIDFAVGYGLDGTSNTDGTILQATIRSVPAAPEPGSPALIIGGALSLAASLRRRRLVAL